MTLESSSAELVSQLKALRESTADLFRIITEDRPYEHSLAHRYENAAGEVAGRLDSALQAALDLQLAGGQYAHGQALAALGTCHAELNFVTEKLYNDLKSYDWLQDLFALGNEHPDEWSGWVISIKATLDECNPSPVHDSLLKCWQWFSVALGATAT